MEYQYTIVVYNISEQHLCSDMGVGAAILKIEFYSFPEWFL